VLDQDNTQELELLGLNLNVLGLLIAKREAVATEAELDGVAHGGAADHFDGCAIAEAHFEQAAADVGVAGNGDHLATGANAKGGEGTGGGWTYVRAAGKITGFLHD
jgi:hypothetical protein